MMASYAYLGGEKEIEPLPAMEAVVVTPVDDAVPAIAIAEPLDVVEEALAQSDTEPTAAVTAARPIDWREYAPYAVMVYFAAAFLLLLRLAAALYGGARLRRDAEPVEDEDVLAAIRQSAEFLRLRVRPVVAYSLRVAGPTVVGVIRPMVLLPASLMTGLSTEQVECLLLHELAHIRRYDHVVNIFQRVIESLLFFHPAVWYV
jgi:beta-lactamase regulating signal transducer with metallopeptidase domain